MATKNQRRGKAPASSTPIAERPSRRPPPSQRAATAARDRGGRAPRRSRGGGRGGDNRSRNMAITWAAATVVIAVVVILIVVKVTGSSTSPTVTVGGPAPASVVHDTTNVPDSTLAAVGVQPSVTNPPKPINDTALTANGKPDMFFVGAEWCPYCAAERWAMVVALSKFGTFSQLGRTQSASDDVFPNTQSFSFHGASYTSPYVAFTGREVQDVNRQSQDPLTAGEQALWNKYNPNSFPFADIGGRYVITVPSFSPAVLQGLDMQTIASQLSNPASQVAQSVNGAANLLIGSICKVTNGQPGNVCHTPTIAKAQATLK